MASNDVYKRAWAIPLTVGASVAVRSPVVVGQLTGVTLTATGASGTTAATVLRHGVAKVAVEGKADAITITLGSVLNTETIIINGKTFTAHTNTTVENTGQFSIAGDNTADAAELVKCMNDATAGLAGCTVTSAAAVVTIVSDKVISAVTGTAESGGKAVVDHAVIKSRDVAEGDELFVIAGTPNTVTKQVSGIHLGWAMGTVSARKITLGTVTNNQTIVINGYTFTAKTTTTTIADRYFSIAGDDTADAALLAANINAAGYGVPGITATAAVGVITLAGDPDVTVTGTAVSAGTCVVAAGTRSINVKLGY